MRVDEDRDALERLDVRLRTILPEEYQDSYEDMQPISMGTAGLKYGKDGKVAWDEIWGSFCDLAMAGGPPHKGALLEPASPAEIEAHAAEYDAVTEEICRGIVMATGLDARRSPRPGWVRAACFSQEMADWLVRAIAMENVAVRREGLLLLLPAGPHFRLHKEIKNVITVVAKTCHFWMGHMPRGQKRAVAQLFETMAAESPLVAPALTGDEAASDGAQAAGAATGDATATAADLADRIADALLRDTGLRRSSHRYIGWLGLECPSVRAAIWMMRALVVSNVLSRREGTTLFLPVNPAIDPEGTIVVRCTTRVHRLAAARGVR